MVARVRLGEWFLTHHIIDESQLLQAIAHQKKTGEKLGQALISLGFITEEQFLDFFVKQLDIAFYDLKQYKPDPTIAGLIPESYARLYHAIVLGKQDNGYLIGTSDPLDVVAINKLSQLIREPITLALIKEPDLERVLNLAYRHTQAIRSYAKKNKNHQLLIDDAYRLASTGITSVSEMIRVTNEGYVQ